MTEIISELEKEYYKYGKIIEAPKKFLQFHTIPQHDGRAHIEYEGSDLIYVITERGIRFNEKRTTNPDELLFWLISDLTFEIANELSINECKTNEEYRKKLFLRQEALIGRINQEWEKQLKKYHDKLL